MAQVPPDSTAQGQAPDNLPPPTSRAISNAAAEQFRIDLLTNIQSSAGVWSGAVAAFLGLFGSVALVTGGDDITKLNGLEQILAIVATVLAGYFGARSLWCLTKAQAMPEERFDNWDGLAYAGYVTKYADAARTNLHLGRKNGLYAAALVFAVGAAVLVIAAIDAVTSDTKMTPPSIYICTADTGGASYVCKTARVATPTPSPSPSKSHT